MVKNNSKIYLNGAAGAHTASYPIALVTVVIVVKLIIMFA